MGKLVVSEFVPVHGVIADPGGAELVCFGGESWFRPEGGIPATFEVFRAGDIPFTGPDLSWEA